MEQTATGHPAAPPGSTAAADADPTDSVRGIELPTRLQRARGQVPAPLRHLLREGARAYGSATASRRPLPDFLIIGAKKAGTSSLMNWLLQHPSVAPMMPRAQGIKSPHYFDINHWRGPDWYASHFPTRGARRRQEQRTSGLSVVGEASPYYLFHPAVPERVVTALPAVRVIVLLRDPVRRAYSNYWDRRTFGTEALPTFEQALSAEPGRLATVDHDRLLTDPGYYSYHHDHHSYLARGHYAEQLGRWTALLPPEQLLVVQAEQLFGDPGSCFETVQRFLRIPISGRPSLTRYNQRHTEPLAEETRARLATHYQPLNAELYALLGRDLGWDRDHPTG